MKDLPPFSEGPSREQIEAFAQLTPAQRFEWWSDMLALCFELAPEEARQQWRRLKAEAHDHRPKLPRP